MQTAEAALFKYFHVKTCIAAQLFNVLSAVYSYVAFADKVSKRHLDSVAEPADCCGIHGHIAKNQSSVRAQYTAYAVKEILRIGILLHLQCLKK